MAKEETQLELSDYRFLQRFLDVTKANLFFARCVMIVEGDAENILLPTLAKLIGRDFTEYGISIVNVGGVGLRRYARIFQRRDIAKAGELGIPVACVTDMDVMPNCGKSIIKKKLPTKGALGELGLKEKRVELSKKTTGQMVKTFIADEWTLEYNLAYCGHAQDVYVAAHLAKRDEYLATKGDALFTTGTKASKTISAQYLSSALEVKQLTADAWRKVLPPYLIEAIDYVTGAVDTTPNADG